MCSLAHSGIGNLRDSLMEYWSIGASSKMYTVYKAHLCGFSRDLREVFLFTLLIMYFCFMQQSYINVKALEVWGLSESAASPSQLKHD